MTDSAGHLLYSREEAKKGKFAFTTEDYEVYEICFQSHGQPGKGVQVWALSCLTTAPIAPIQALPAGGQWVLLGKRERYGRWT